MIGGREIEGENEILTLKRDWSPRKCRENEGENENLTLKCLWCGLGFFFFFLGVKGWVEFGYIVIRLKGVQ